MDSMRRKAFRIVSVMLVVCFFQVYVLAGATTPNVAGTNTKPMAGSMLGRLMLVGTESILVNGNSANSGTTILSGSQLQTSSDVDATVQLGTAGKLYIEPNTNLTVTFNKANVDVKVTAGSAFVAANTGVKSTVTNPNGRTSTLAAAPGAPAPEMTDNEKKAAIVIPIVIAAIIIIYLVTRDDGSPS